MAIINKFLNGGDDLITIQPGTNTYEVIGISGDLDKHFPAIRFLDGNGDEVVPTDGLVKFEGNLFRESPTWDSIENGEFDAVDTASPTRNRPSVGGPMVSCRLTLTDIAGAVSAEAVIWSQ